MGCTTSIKLLSGLFLIPLLSDRGLGWGLNGVWCVHLLYFCFVCTFYTLILPLSYWVYAMDVGLLWGLPRIGVKTLTKQIYVFMLSGFFMPKLINNIMSGWGRYWIDGDLLWGFVVGGWVLVVGGWVYSCSMVVCGGRMGGFVVMGG